MSGGISAGTMMAMAAAATVAVVATKSMQPDMPKMPDLKAPEMPQGAAMPDQQAQRARSSAQGGGFSPAAMGTMLTGASGVDPGSLSLGKNTLLGQ